MSELTYTVFLVVVTMIGALVALFTAGVIGVLFTTPIDSPRLPKAAELPRAA